MAPPSCDAYIACAGVVDAAGAADVEANYGDGGTCLKNETEEDCAQTCSEELAALADANPGVAECPTRAQTVAGIAGNSSNGGVVYDATCGVPNCHGPNGDDGLPTSGSLPDLVPTLSKEELIDIILVGSGDMVPLGHLSDQEIADVVLYAKGRWQ